MEQMFRETDKCRCENRRCGWKGKPVEVLAAPSPFEADEMIFACPQCKDIGSVQAVCDEPGCWESVTCGTPVGKLYWNTCGAHAPKAQRAKKGDE